MRRLNSARALIFAVLGAAVLASATTAYAATAAPAPGARAAHTAGIVSGRELEQVFTGLTYPDTPYGLSSCQAQGAWMQSESGSEVVAYSCPLNDPTAGVYNLWVVNYSGCKECVKKNTPELAAEAAARPHE